MYQEKIFVIEKMNMPFTITFVKRKFNSEENFYKDIVKNIEGYLGKIEDKFSPFKDDSLVRVHDKLIANVDKRFFDEEYQEVYVRCLQATKETRGYFNPTFNGSYNPTGFVKGWMIENAFFNYLKPLIDNNIVEAAGINGAGDMQLGTAQNSDFFWQVGIENPSDKNKIIAKYSVKNGAIATSGLSKRGEHIASKNEIDNIQVSVVGEYLSDVDVLATTGVAMPRGVWYEYVEENRLTGILVNKEKKIITYEGGKLNEIKRS